MLAAEEQDSSPLTPLRNQEGTAGDHTNAPPPMEGDIGDDPSLHLDANSPNQQPMHPIIEEQVTITNPIDVAEDQDRLPLPPLRNQEGTVGDHTDTPAPMEGDIGDDLSLHLDANSPTQQPTHPIIEEQPTITDPMDVVMHDEPKGNDPDLLYRIRGFYRLLDLINEQGSGGAGMINASHSKLSGLKLPFLPSGQGHHRSRVRGEVCERYLPGCLHLRVKGD